MKYKILQEKVIFNNFLKIVKATIQHQLFDSNKTVKIERYALDKNDAVAAVLYEKDTDTFLFANQFRYPILKKNKGNAWLLELVAGTVEGNEEPKERMKKEIEEEIGYKTNNMHFIHSFFVTPGICSEKIFLYYSEVNSTDKIFKGGGVKEENEDIQLVKIKPKQVTDLLKKNQIQDAKTIIGLQWYLLNKD